MMPPILRPPPSASSALSSSSSSSSFSIQSLQSKIRHWWTQSNHQALHISQDVLLRACVQTPYVSTSCAGMNSVEFQRPQQQQQQQQQQQRRSYPPTDSPPHHHNQHHNQQHHQQHHQYNHGHYHHSQHQHHSHHYPDRRCFHTNFHLKRPLQRCSIPHPAFAAAATSNRTTATAPTTTTVILTHGFGSGLGFFYKNVDLLFDLYPQTIDRVVLVDWMGMGGSDRPPVVGPRRRQQQQQRRHLLLRPNHNHSHDNHLNNNNNNSNHDTTQQAVDFFIEPFHEWFEQSILGRRGQSSSHEEEQIVSGKENIVLVGHSLGGYLCGQYAIKYPQHLSKLVLASPVGFSYHHHHHPTTTTHPSHLYPPNQFSENLYSHFGTRCHPDPSIAIPSSIPTTSTPSQTEATAIDPGATVLSTVTTTKTSSSINDVATNDRHNTVAAVMPSSTKSLIRILSTLWRSNVTPQQLIRICGATQGRANVHRKLRQKLSATISTTGHSSKESASQAPPNLHSDYDIQLLADYLYHITVADPSGEFAMNALLEPTLVTKIVPTMSTTTTSIVETENSVVPPSQQQPSPPPGILSTMTKNNPTQRNDSSTDPLFHFPEEPTKNGSTDRSSPITSSVPKTTTTTTSKTYSAMGVSAREPLQELLAQTLDTSHGLQCVKVLYGSHDWMRPNEMIARQSLQQLQARTGIETSVNVVPNAGHHLYMESPVEFVNHIMN